MVAIFFIKWYNVIGDYMSFASNVKNEICKLEFENICCIRAELAGIVCFAAQISVNSIKINTENKMVAKRIADLVNHIYNLNMEVVVRQSGIITLRMNGIDVLKILRDMRLGTVPIRIEKEIVRRECCKRSFIRGAFLGGGSIISPEKGYHLELVTSHYALCKDFAVILEFFSIAPRFLNRKGNYVFYIKDSEQIGDFLAALGAHNHMMEFLNIKIEKEVRNVTNRRVNCETSNAEKCAGASVAQIHAIRLIDKHIGLDNISPQLKSIAEKRLNNPEATLSDLAKELGISKSGANHRMRKLIQMAKELKDG